MEWMNLEFLKSQKFKLLILIVLLLCCMVRCAIGNTAKSEAKEQTNTQTKVETATESSAPSKESETNSDKTDEAGNEADETIADGQYPIMGKSGVTVEQMVAYYKDNGAKYPKKKLKKGGAPSIESFCKIYFEESEKEGVRAEVAYAQTMKETGWLQYGGDSTIEQFNFAGLGTTGGGVKGNAYPDVRTGVRAQIQHLKAYATKEKLNETCVDDRYSYVKKGSAPYVEWLGQKENPKGYGWATGKNYGPAIVNMIKSLKKS